MAIGRARHPEPQTRGSPAVARFRRGLERPAPRSRIRTCSRSCRRPRGLAWHAHRACRPGEDVDLFVAHQMDRDPRCVLRTGVGELEERGARYELVLADTGQQRHAPLQRHKSGVDRGVPGPPRNVAEFAAAPERPGGHDQVAAGLQQPVAAFKDFPEAVEQVVQAAVGEVAVVAAVAEVALGDPVAAGVARGADVPV